MSNLPPGVSVNDLPGNQRHPEPDDFCDHCGRPVFHPRYDQSEVKLTVARKVVHKICQNCGEVMYAFDVDQTKGFLIAMRKEPEEMLKDVSSFDELKEL